MEDLKKFDEETNSRGYRNEVSVPYEGKLVTGRMTNGRRFGAIIITESATLGLTVSKKGTDGFGVRNSRATGIPLSELNEVFGEVRLIVEDIELGRGQDFKHATFISACLRPFLYYFVVMSGLDFSTIRFNLLPAGFFRPL